MQTTVNLLCPTLYQAFLGGPQEKIHAPATRKNIKSLYRGLNWVQSHLPSRGSQPRVTISRLRPWSQFLLWEPSSFGWEDWSGHIANRCQNGGWKNRKLGKICKNRDEFCQMFAIFSRHLLLSQLSPSLYTQSSSSFKGWQCGAFPIVLSWPHRFCQLDCEHLDTGTGGHSMVLGVMWCLEYVIYFL